VVLIRSLFALCLALTLAAANIGFGVAKGTAHPVTHAVICQGLTLTVIALDARGNPVETPHLCPDAAAGFGAEGGTMAYARAPVEVTALTPSRPATSVVARVFDTGPRARAPPGLS